MKFFSIKPIFRGLIATSLSISHAWAMDEILSPFETTKDIRVMIVSVAAVEQALINKPLADLAWVNKEWLQVVKTAASHVNGPLRKALQGVRDENDDATYQAFLNGKLVYRPDLQGGVVELKISDFQNPFKGTFDLSKCGEAAHYITITTDPSVFFQINKAHPTCHILIIPYFSIKKYITSTAKPFDKIMRTWDKDKAPVGMFWRWSAFENLSWYDYLTTAGLSAVSSKNLCGNWSRGTRCRHGGSPGVSRRYEETGWSMFMFSCLFMSQNKD